MTVECKSEVERNSEILFLYDARMCNPNGDPDEENRPRMDYETHRNLVSDVRLKRYLRDYWIAWKPEEVWTKPPWSYPVPQDVWVQSVGDKVVTAKERIEKLAEKFCEFCNEQEGSKPKACEGEKPRVKELSKEASFRQWLLERLIDVRLFGATMPIGAETEGGAGGHVTYTGPVQFTWGYSLNQVELLPSSTITSHFAGRERGEKGEYGTMGKDWRVKYSFLAFYGLVSAWRAEETCLKFKDIELLDHSLVNALPLMATSRSKIGQTPRLYLRVEYTNDATFLGDFRTRLALEKDEGLESIADVQMQFDALVDFLARNQAVIQSIVVWAHEEFASGQALAKALQERLKDKVVDLDAMVQRLKASE